MFLMQMDKEIFLVLNNAQKLVFAFAKNCYHQEKNFSCKELFHHHKIYKNWCFLILKEVSQF